jgi:ribonucleotide monophosphatase NagD (HAD superfamily)
MGFIIIDKIKNNNKKIMIFVEGTILKPKYNNILSRISMTTYIPINNAIETLKKWQEEGYEVIYLTSLKGRRAMKMAQHLDELGFTGSMVGYRQKNQDYATLIKEELPDILIEDNCLSVGGEQNMCYNLLNDELKKEIKHIVVEEFKGIDDIKLY